MFFSGDIVITDPCYIVKNGADWGNCDYGQALDALGISTFLSTGEADCGGSYVLRGADGTPLGEFCSDSSVVSVIDAGELTAYNPNWTDALGDNCCTLLRGFCGEVTLSTGEDWAFRGDGSIPFRTERR